MMKLRTKLFIKLVSKINDVHRSEWLPEQNISVTSMLIAKHLTDRKLDEIGN